MFSRSDFTQRVYSEAPLNDSNTENAFKKKTLSASWSAMTKGAGSGRAKRQFQNRMLQVGIIMPSKICSIEALSLVDLFPQSWNVNQNLRTIKNENIFFKVTDPELQLCKIGQIMIR